MFFIPLLLSGILRAAAWSAISINSGIGNAGTENILPLLIYFNSDDCTTCDEFDALFEKAEILQRLEKKYVPVKVNINHLDGRVCADIYDVTYIPAFVIADQKGVILYKSDETLTVDEITRLIETIPDQFVQPVSESEKSVNVSQAEERTMAIIQVPVPVIPDSSEGNVFAQKEKVGGIDPASEIPKAVPVKNSHDLSAPQNEQKGIPADKQPILTEHNYPPKESPAIHSVNKPMPTTKSAKSSATTVSRAYAIQLGYFTEEMNARRLMQKAVEKGLADTRVQTETRNGISYFRVLIGRCPTLTEAQKLLDQVHSVGLKGAVHRQ